MKTPYNMKTLGPKKRSPSSPFGLFKAENILKLHFNKRYNIKKEIKYKKSKNHLYLNSKSLNSPNFQIEISMNENNFNRITERSIVSDCLISQSSYKNISQNVQIKTNIEKGFDTDSQKYKSIDITQDNISILNK